MSAPEPILVGAILQAHKRTAAQPQTYPRGSGGPLLTPFLLHLSPPSSQALIFPRLFHSLLASITPPPEHAPSSRSYCSHTPLESIPHRVYNMPRLSFVYVLLVCLACCEKEDDTDSVMTADSIGHPFNLKRKRIDFSHKKPLNITNLTNGEREAVIKFNIPIEGDEMITFTRTVSPEPPQLPCLTHINASDESFELFLNHAF
ncbi:hypothetical protein F5Y18DRAFT_431626 [Xylariaceae sp. FL1019]|nr:hypothetical protein F5Y18DRAFT_431626 [Xylariaceae sp. FL1019]